MKFITVRVFFVDRVNDRQAGVRRIYSYHSISAQGPRGRHYTTYNIQGKILYVLTTTYGKDLSHAKKTNAYKLNLLTTTFKYNKIKIYAT